MVSFSRFFHFSCSSMKAIEELLFLILVTEIGKTTYWYYSEFQTDCCSSLYQCSLRKQTTFGDATTGFLAKWRLSYERRNSILMTRQHPHLGSASDWSCRVGNSTNQKHYPELGWEASGSATKCRLFSQANYIATALFLYAGEEGKGGQQWLPHKKDEDFCQKTRSRPPKIKFDLGEAQALLDPKWSSSIKRVMLTHLCSNHFLRKYGLRPVHSEVNEFLAIRVACASP